MTFAMTGLGEVRLENPDDLMCSSPENGTGMPRDAASLLPRQGSSRFTA